MSIVLGIVWGIGVGVIGGLRNWSLPLTFVTSFVGSVLLSSLCIYLHL